MLKPDRAGWRTRRPRSPGSRDCPRRARRVATSSFGFWSAERVQQMISSNAPLRIIWMILRSESGQIGLQGCCTLRTNDYVLGTHDGEISRLGLQHRVWRPHMLDAWMRAGMTTGSRVVD